MREPLTILGRLDFDRRFGNLYRSLFRGDEPFRRSFRNEDWQFVVTPNSFQWKSEEFAALCSAAEAVGDTEMVWTNLTEWEWTNLKIHPQCSLSCVLPLSFDAYAEEFRRNRELDFLRAGRKAIFGPSGSWAAVVDEFTYFSGGFAMIGGVAPFTDELIRSRGGVERMRSYMLELLDDPTAFTPPDLRERLLEEVGWQ